jgi:hypothetical protein
MRGAICPYPSPSMKREPHPVFRRLASAVAAFALVACAAAPLTGDTPDAPDALVLSSATILRSPTEAPLADGVVVVRAGKIVAAGKRDAVAIPPGATIVDCRGRFLVAGFQNSHVHFIEPKWDRAHALPVAQLSRQLEDIALRWGCTTVVDTGSDLANTLALRDRVAPGMDADLVLLGAARLLASERILRAGLAGYRPSLGAVVLPPAGGQIEIG